MLAFYHMFCNKHAKENMYVLIVTDLSVNRFLLNTCVSGYLKLVIDFIAALYNTVTTRYPSPTSMSLSVFMSLHPFSDWTKYTFELALKL